MTDIQTHRSPFRRTWRAVRARPRLFIAAAFGIGAFLTLPADWRLTTRLLVGWDMAIFLYLVLMVRLMVHSDVNRIKRRARLQDEGKIVILGLIVTAALASLGAIVAELGGAQGAGKDPAHLGLAACTILLSWAFTHSIFALHYAHEYYDENAHRGGGLNFPGQEPPDYWDFVYFSFVIGMTSQVSDVAVTSSAFRRLVAAHGVLSFIFNATLLALTVNIAAGAI
jgi:uncharacterized membrane protein